MNTHLCRTILAMGALLALMPGGYAQAEKPNILIMFIDDMGYGDIGPFGNTVTQTPYLDRVAEHI